MKIVFEGTEEQIENLKVLFEQDRAGDIELPRMREDYQTENLWCVEDAQGMFECTDDEALDLCEKALTNNATMEQIWFAMEFEGEEMGLKKVDE